ncbi:autotransporter assembly complex protein TamA [Propionivibrio sp.]|uniref:autotransporter assembly complex protein TamA n=1 Tax=Propionivibrio sp. TaxID=2212460 RepID=UPI00272E3E5A|nr:autotransporter assembly complex family protein [Propionivibrio sp.]
MTSRFRFLPRLAGALLLALAVSASRAEIVLHAPEPITALLTPYLPEQAISPRRLQTMLEEILATEGYFSPAIKTREEGETLRVDIEPGPRTRITDVDLTIDGPVAESVKTQLQAGWRLPAGEPFRQQDWSTAKQQILGELLASDHADAQLIDSEARIDSETRQASLRAHYDAGPRYRFGTLRVDGLHRHSPELVARYNRAAKAGDRYSEARLGELQRTLQATPYFSSVRVTIDRENAAADEDGRTAPVLVTVRERPAHRFGIGAGVSTNTGARVEATYHTPDLFGQSWALDGGLRIEQKKQTAYADVFLPPDEKNRRHGFGALAETSDIEGLKTRRHAFGVQTVQPRGSVEQRLSLNWQEERRTPDGAAQSTNQALVPDAMWTWRNIDDPLDPRRGTVLQASIGGAAKALLSDQDFLRLHGRWLQYLPLGQRDTLALRVEIGATLADSRQGIPQDYLFRAGGAGSVRGYTYQSLGVKEGSATVGGRYLGIASIEATHWFTPEWGAAAFIDAGDAADTAGDLNLAVGYGLGVRWRSPAGPIGADLAYGQRTGELHIHFALAIPF